MDEEISISEDSIRLLFFIKRQRETNSDEIIKYSKWDIDRITDAIDFLYEEGLIHEPKKMLSGRIIFIKCTSEGIKYVENPNKFRINNNFNINVNINFDSLIKVNIDKIFETKLF